MASRSIPTAPTTVAAGSIRRSASREDALALLAGLADGTVDAIATDHAPHPPQRKLVPFDDAAPGLIGLETALSLGLAAVAAGRLELATLVAALSIRPAEIIGERRSLALGAGGRPGGLRPRGALARRGVGAGFGVVEHAAAGHGAAGRRAADSGGRPDHLSSLSVGVPDMGPCGSPHPFEPRRGMACQFATTRSSTRTRVPASDASSRRRSCSPSSCSSSRSASSPSTGRSGCWRRCSSSTSSCSSS